MDCCLECFVSFVLCHPVSVTGSYTEVKIISVYWHLLLQAKAWLATQPFGSFCGPGKERL